MPEYIDRNKIYYTRWQKKDGTFSDGVTLESVISDMPTVDAVEVVRCKDCKYYKVGNPNSDYCYHIRHEHHAQGTSYSPDDFCSYGESKTDD